MFVARALLRKRRVYVLGAAAVLSLVVLFHENDRDTITRQQSLRVIDSPPPTNYTVFMRGTKGATGNLMFMFASLYGIARRNHRKPVMMLTGCRRLQNLFLNIRVECADSDMAGVDLEEHAYGTYDASLEKLPAANAILTGYYQSWKYFQEYATDVREQLIFRPRFLMPATRFLRNISKRSCDQCGPTTFVGVHVRRGDRVEIRHFRRRYNVASGGYLRKAMDYFRQRYTDVHFVVCSDSMAWCEETLGRQNDVTFTRASNAGTDLAILSVCNHTVFTVGTFGWWAAWLAGGTAVYFPDHLNVSAPLYTELNVNDYFIPRWIPMTD